MAGFEVVVRPVIFPDIRPRPRAAPAPPDDPTKGFAVIAGNPAGSTSNSYSFSVNASYSHPKEKHRRVDVVRVKPTTGSLGGEDGEGDGGGGGGGGGAGNYVDMEVANRIAMEEHGGPVIGDPGAGGGGGPVHMYYYQPVSPATNVEILLRDQMRKAPE